jgi:putative N6-adenine-specific DNA methylase
LLARKIAPGLHRQFAFTQWPGFDRIQWAHIVAEARERELPRAPGLICASDRDTGAIRAAMGNAERADVTSDIDISQRAISAVTPIGARGWIITNPPYGVRVGDTNVRNLYAQFGKLLRANFAGWHTGILSADPALERQIGVKFERSFCTSNGGIPVRFITSGVLE